jgi:phosphate transport system substrate-binding protein
MRTAGIGLAFAAALGLGGAALAQSGQTVTLKSFDGFTQLRGELVDFDGETFTIRTRLGTLEVDALQVECEGPACPPDLLFGAEFGIHGSNTIGDSLMPALIEGYADQLGGTIEREIGTEENEAMFRLIHESGQEMAAISLEAHGSGTSFPALAEGRAAVGMASRRMRDDEATLLANVGIDELRETDDEHILAFDGLAIIVHPDNPVSALSISQIAQVFAGEVSNWSELGGANMPINIHARDDRSGTFDTFDSLVLEANGLELAEDAERHEDNAALADAVASDRAAIGFTGFASARAAKAVPVRNECGILSAPTHFNVKTEEYPLSRRLYLYTTPAESPAHANRLVDFALSEEATPYIEGNGFVSLAPESQGIGNQGVRLAHAITSSEEFSLELLREMLLDLDGAERLSTTFRFTPGSSELTSKSEADARKLAEDLAAGVYDGREVMLVGFTDSIGQFELNQQLAERRAQGVLGIIESAVPEGALDDAGIAVRGYGELTPVGCNTTFSGRVLNRRVEVWVR